MQAFQVAGKLLLSKTRVSEFVRAEVRSACKREKYFYIESISLGGREHLQISFFESYCSFNDSTRLIVDVLFCFTPEKSQ